LKTLETTLCTTNEDDILDAKRIYVIGRNADIQADLALPLAVKILQKRRGDVLQIVLTEALSKRTWAGLKTQCSFLGIAPVQKDIRDLSQEFTDNKCEIVFLNESQVHLIGEVSGKETQTLIALNQGLHPKLIDQMLLATGDLYPSIAFVGLGEWIPQPEELSAIAARGSALIWSSKTAALCDDLNPFNGETLGRWAKHWITSQEDNTQEPILTFKSRKTKSTSTRGGAS
jgi:hypothetical protein